MASERDPPSQSSPATDEEAEHGLYPRFAKPLRVMAMRYLGDAAEADDIAHEALSRVVEALRAGRIRQLAALPGFVFETGRHLCLQRLRRGRRATLGLLRFGHEPRRDEEPGALGLLLRSERLAAVRRALAPLAADERELLRLAFDEALTSEEIGARLGLAAGAVRVRKHRLLRQLAQVLGQDQPARNASAPAATEREGDA